MVTAFRLPALQSFIIQGIKNLFQVHTIEGNDIGTVWIESIKAVLQHGTSITDDKGPIREISPLYLHISHPSEQDAILERFGDRDVLSFMQRNFEDFIPVSGWGYSYAKRLYSGEGGNSIAQLIERLKHNPTAKSASLSLLKPEDDKHHTPCLTTLDFKVRQHTLCIHAFFRSQDIGKKMYADALQLFRLGQNMKKELFIDHVSLFLSISSAHVYEEDIPELQQFVKMFV